MSGRKEPIGERPGSKPPPPPAPPPKKRRGKAWCMECDMKPSIECDQFNHDVTVVEIDDEEGA